MEKLVFAVEGYVFTNPVASSWPDLVKISALVCLDDFVSQVLFVQGKKM